MPSTFAWLDYSESERQKALDVIQAFGDQGTLMDTAIKLTSLSCIHCSSAPCQ